MELRTPLRNNGFFFWIIGTVVLFSVAVYFSSYRVFTAIVMTIIAAVLVLFRLSETFTNVVRINNDQLEIVYTQLFRKKFISIPVAAATLSLKYKSDSSAGDGRKTIIYRLYYSLHIYEKGKQRHRITEDEGYSKDDFIAFIHEFNAASQRLT